MLLSCNNSNEEYLYPKALNMNSSGTTFTGGIDNVSVYIFQQSNTDNQYYYDGIINTGWSSNNTINKNLELGNYKFLFMKCPEKNTTISPDLNLAPKFDEIKIMAKTTNTAGYVYPVDEIWLPEIFTVANKEYSIKGGEKIKNNLTRAVSQIELKVKRAFYDNGIYIDSIPFNNGKNILENINHIDMTVEGVGEAINLAGGIGEKNMSYVFSPENAVVNPTGFAVFKGPFVFPNGTGKNATVNFTLKPTLESGLPELKKTISGKLERNKKLSITLWLSSTYKLIDISYQISFFDQPVEGEEGIWD